MKIQLLMDARVAELVDALDLGSSETRRYRLLNIRICVFFATKREFAGRDGGGDRLNL